MRTPVESYTSPRASLASSHFPLVPPTSLTAILKTPSIHHDEGCNFEMAFTLFPAISLHNVPMNRFSVQGGAVPAACDITLSTINSIAGTGVCVLSQSICSKALPAQDSARVQKVTLVYTGTQTSERVVSNEQSVNVAATLPPLIIGGEHIHLGTAVAPRVPVPLGAPFPVQVYATPKDAEGQATPVAFWRMEIRFNPKTLSLPENQDMQVTAASGFWALVTNVVTASPSEHVLYASSRAVPGTPPPTGAHVHTATINFRVASNAMQGSQVDGILSARYVGMLAPDNVDILGTHPEIMFNDATGVLRGKAVVLPTLTNVVVGLQASVSHPHLVMRPDGSPREKAAIQLQAVRTGFGSTNIAVDTFDCSTTGNALVVQSCADIRAASNPSPVAR